MQYQTFEPHKDLASFIKCYWTLEVPAESSAEKQRIIPDGCIEMAFILGDDIQCYTSEDEFILQPRALVLGQTLAPFYIKPTGYVHTFAIRFYPYGFSNFVSKSLHHLANTETPIALLFEESTAKEIERNIVQATHTQERIQIIERFFLDRLTEKAVIDQIVKTTLDALLASKGSASILTILKEEASKRRQLERRFLKLIGMSPKQLGKVIRLQAALKLLLQPQPESLTHIAYESQYYDQTHFIKDFKEFTGITPKDFLEDDSMRLSSLFYSND